MHAIRRGTLVAKNELFLSGEASMHNIFRSSVIFCATALVAIGGCSDSSDEDESAMGAGPVVIADDLEFIDALVPHHEMAVMMADMELQAGSDAHVKSMAQTMKDAQQAEIAELKATRKKLAGTDSVPEMQDPHMDADMAAMHAASGAQLDRLFVEHMLPHHAGAIQMAHNALPNLKEANLKTMAMAIIESQAEEVGMLHDMLQSM